MDQKTICSLLDTYPTPFYVFEESALKERIRRLRTGLPKWISLCYAVKANPFLGRFLTDSVERFEICSPGEMYICEAQGIPARKFVLSGVYKDEVSMRYAFEHGLCEGILTVESVRQFELLQKLAEEYRHPVLLLFRLTSGNQFGLAENELIDLLKRCPAGPGGSHAADGSAADGSALDGPARDGSAADGSASDDAGCRKETLLRTAGIQFFSGTQRTSLKKHRRELALLDDVIDRIRIEVGMEVPELEYGPGLPAAYFVGEDFDEDAWLEEFSGMLNGMRNRLPITLELGRGIAASCGSLFSRVADVKCNQSGRYAIMDSGIHHLTYYGQFMAMKHPVCTIWPPRDPQPDDPEWNLCGALCTINDLLVKQMPFHDLKCGDVLIFRNTGAYSMTEGISLFLSRDLPGVVWLKEDGETQFLRSSEPTWRLNGGQV